MKNYLFVSFLFFVSLFYGQKRIMFTYDDAGNQIRRYICVNCSAKNYSPDFYKDEETIISNDMFVENSIKYYPNPVKEVLYVQWENINNNEVIIIEVYTMTGQLLMSNNNLKNIEKFTISFISYPSGYYNVLLVYKNGEKRDLKIIKQ